MIPPGRNFSAVLTAAGNSPPVLPRRSRIRARAPPIAVSPFKASSASWGVDGWKWVTWREATLPSATGNWTDDRDDPLPSAMYWLANREAEYSSSELHAPQMNSQTTGLMVRIF